MAAQKAKKKPVKKTAKRKSTSLKLEGYPKWLITPKWMGAIVFLIGFLLYANTFYHDFAQDDTIVITENMYTTAGVSGISGILGKDTFFGFFKDPSKANLVAGGRYRPLSLVMFAIEYELFGANPFVGHFINALLYGFTGLVLYWFILLLFPPKQHGFKGHWLAVATSLLFLAHPIHTEVVANIKGRDEILALLLSLGTFYFSLQAYFKKGVLYPALAGLTFFLALMSKENAATFLAVIPLGFYFFTKAPAKAILIQTGVLIVAFAVFWGIRSSILSGALDAPLSQELMNNPFLKWNGTTYVDMTFMERMGIVFFTLGKYIQLLLFPYPLTHDYYPRQIPIQSWLDWKVILSFVLYAAMGIYALIKLKKKDLFSFCILYYLLTVSIVSNIVFPIGTNMSERFMYMPSVGFSLALAWGAYLLFSKKKPLSYKKVVPYLGGLAAIVLIFGSLTISRNRVWKDNFTLFTNDIQISYNSAKLRNAVAGELLTQSLKPQYANEKNGMVQEAIGHLKEALAIHPAYKNATLLMGNAYSYLGQHDNALQYYNMALGMDPLYRDAILNQSITYMNLKQPEKALENIQLLIDSYPDDPQYKEYLASAYRDMGRQYGEERGDLGNALVYLRKAEEINPQDYETLRLMGVAYGFQNQPAKALEYFKKAYNVKPGDADAMYNLGTAYYNNGDQAQGESFRQKAIALDPSVGQRMGN